MLNSDIQWKQSTNPSLMLKPKPHWAIVRFSGCKNNRDTTTLLSIRLVTAILMLIHEVKDLIIKVQSQNMYIFLTNVVFVWFPHIVFNVRPLWPPVLKSLYSPHMSVWLKVRTFQAVHTYIYLLYKLVYKNKTVNSWSSTFYMLLHIFP